MFNFLKKRKTAEPQLAQKPQEEKAAKQSAFDIVSVTPNKFQDALLATFQRTTPLINKALEGKFITAKKDQLEGVAMDSAPLTSIPTNLSSNIENYLLLGWYAGQGFIGWQFAAILSQHWLIDKACLMPAEDAIRNGYEITVNDGTEVAPEVWEAIHELDIKFKLKEHLLNYLYKGRIFGVRLVKFHIKSKDKDYYENPFNLDGITEGSYQGISQIDPYWTAPILDEEGSSNPDSLNFYEPKWWQLQGRRIERSHFVIFRTEDVVDILKPTYFFGGIPIPQKIYEKVFNAERSANEAPLLLLTKRTDVIKTDLEGAISNQQAFDQRIADFTFRRNNLGLKILAQEDEMQQFDTSLTDLDAVIMTQYQLVAAAACVPATKLLGTTPKGFNATGEYEESSYHEFLKSMQIHKLTPFLERHYQILLRSEIAPRFKIKPFAFTIKWNALNELTAEEEALINRTRSETAKNLVETGAIDSTEERARIISDPKSGYSGLIDEFAEPELDENEKEEI